MSTSKDIETTAVRATSIDYGIGSGSGHQSPINIADEHGTPEVIDGSTTESDHETGAKKTWKSKFAYFKTKDFWCVLALGQILAVCITGTNTLTSLLVQEGTSIPAFQTLFNYVLLNLVYTSITIYKYGFKKWTRVLWKDGWKCEF